MLRLVLLFKPAFPKATCACLPSWRKQCVGCREPGPPQRPLQPRPAVESVQLPVSENRLPCAVTSPLTTPACGPVFSVPLTQSDRSDAVKRITLLLKCSAVFPFFGQTLLICRSQKSTRRHFFPTASWRCYNWGVAVFLLKTWANVWIFKMYMKWLLAYW